VIDPATPGGARALERLEREIVAWLTTVTPGGQPQASPVWFLWDDGELLIYSRADTPRAANLRANPRVAVNLNSSADGGAVLTIEGEARIVRDRATVADAPPAYFAKYAAGLAESGWTMDSFLADYPVEVRVRVSRVRTW
jgi:PPOX class probable F420-dependent enzyme